MYIVIFVFCAKHFSTCTNSHCSCLSACYPDVTCIIRKHLAGLCWVAFESEGDGRLRNGGVIGQRLIRLLYVAFAVPLRARSVGVPERVVLWPDMVIESGVRDTWGGAA